MKIVLIHSYLTTEIAEFIQTPSEPLGLLSLATYVEAKSKGSIDISILDLYALGYDLVKERGQGRHTTGVSDETAIAELLTARNPDVVGIHCNFTGYAQDALEVAAIVKKVLPNSVVVLGGAHASYEAKNLLGTQPCIDYVVRQEGEISFYELVEALREHKGVEDIKGIAYRDHNRNVCVTPQREMIQDIDLLPIPDREFIDMKTYLYLNRKSFPLAKKYPVATIMASRGCPFNCIFCSTKNMWGKRWRGRSPLNIIREIEGLIAHYGVREIAFYDDQFLVDKKWVEQICDFVIEKRLGISLSLPAGTSVWIADENLLRKMKKAGFYRLTLPIESGNASTLKFIRKPVKLENVVETIKTACRLGFWTAANFIIGFPYETREQILETIHFAYNCGIDYPFFFIARPFPGAEMYTIYQKEGLLVDRESSSSSVFVAKSGTLHLTAAELMQIRAEAEKGFLRYKFRWCLDPKNFVNYVLPRISTWDGIKYAVKILFSLVLGKHRRLFKKNLAPDDIHR